jgi:hypothetical protein
MYALEAVEQYLAISEYSPLQPLLHALQLPGLQLDDIAAIGGKLLDYVVALTLVTRWNGKPLRDLLSLAEGLLPAKPAAAASSATSLGLGLSSAEVIAGSSCSRVGGSRLPLVLWCAWFSLPCARARAHANGPPPTHRRLRR